MISFKAAFRKEFELADLIKLAKLTAQLCEPEKFHLEYTIGIENYDILEKFFSSFEEVEEFLNLTPCDFDSLRIIEKSADHFVSFRQNSGRFSFFGRRKDTAAVETIVNSVGEQILYAYFHDNGDILLSRVCNYQSWKRQLGKVPNYVRYYDNPGYLGGERNKYTIDLETVPTHQHFIKTGDKLWFGACAMMYFSDLYYKYIPKEKWDQYTDCVENTVLKNGLRKITLYTDFADCENSANRDRQWQFRRQLDIDTVAHGFDRSRPVPEELLIPLQTGETFHMDWVSITDMMDALQISSGQTFGKEKLREIVTQLEGDKVILVKKGASSKLLKSQEDLQLLIDSYDARIVISDIL